MSFIHQLVTGISFGLTNSVINTLGMIVGLYSATASKLAVVAAILIMAIADGLSNALGLHTAEEAEIENGVVKHTSREVWLTTVFTFSSGFLIYLSFLIPILIFPLKTAIISAIFWGLFLLVVLNFQIAKSRKARAMKIIFEHISLALFIIFVSYWVGEQIPRILK